MASNANTQISLAKVAEYVETLTRDPKSKVFVPLGEIYRQSGMVDEAQAVVLKGLKQNPDYGLGYIALGRVLLAKDLPEKAEKAYRKALRFEPENLSALKGLLRLLWNRGDTEGAGEMAETLVRVKPGDPDAEKVLKSLAGRSEKQTGAGASAGKEKTAAGAEKAEGDEPIQTATLADIYVRQGLYAKALNLYRQILASNPQNQEIKRKAQAAQKRLDEQRSEAEPDTTASNEGAAGAQEQIAARDTETPPNASDSVEATIRVLESWLDGIRQRREHVQ
ncbi:MAG: tetratricopeptide repeat protein [Desulfuromonadales bacterium]|nr:tetratricopeptide repeat protein [Desulfuromonadales bacterium]NIR32987.1 tetratricopeptide repeat protein [Desulfuromonadales bacterium]NIS40325.1 tetratricopeptide repeat protein [Desulfuromonadales bacterium]